MLNKVMLIGNLGADPEVRYTASGETITSIRIATSRRWKDKQSGEQREQTEWHRITFFNIGNFRLAEVAAEYLKKGSKVYVEGRLQTRKWQDKTTGQDRYSTDIIADQMQMLDSRTGGTAPMDQTQAAPMQAQQQPQQQAYQAPAQTQPAYQQPATPQMQPQQPQQPAYQAPPAQPQQNYAAVPPAPTAPTKPMPAAPKDDYDDDIPF